MNDIQLRFGDSIFQKWSVPHASCSRPTVLYVTNQLPVPSLSGGQVRESQLIQRLSNSFDIHFLAFTCDFERDRANAEEFLVGLSSITLVKVNPTLDLSSCEPPRMQRFRCMYGVNIVEDLISTVVPALIHVEGYFLMQHMPSANTIPVVLAEENIEYLLDESSRDPCIAKFGVAGRQKERQAWEKATICVAVTPEDATIMQQECPHLLIRCVGNGFDHLPLGAVRPLTSEKSVLYTANYQWGPSADGVHYLLDDIWPLVAEIVPDARLLLAGFGMSSALQQKALQNRNVIVIGQYDTFAEVADLAKVFACTLRFGGGIKVKMIEAITYGLPTVATPLCLNGLPQDVRDLVFTSESPICKAVMISALLESTAAVASVHESLLRLKGNLPSWDAAAGLLLDTWKEAIQL